MVVPWRAEMTSLGHQEERWGLHSDRPSTGRVQEP